MSKTLRRAKSSFDEIAATGEFKRQPTSFHGVLSGAAGSKHPVEKGRYVLYVSYACPWASRVLAVRRLKGLEDFLPVVQVAPVWGVVEEETEALSWVFRDETFGGLPTHDSVYGHRTLRELYERADPDYAGKYTVPVLWDRKTESVVNNESSELIEMLNDNCNDVALFPDVDLYPRALRGEIDELNEYFYNTVNNGVYRCGFATTQQAYDTAFTELFATLDQLERRLQGRRFLVGDRMTFADIRLFVTLVRFDPVYYVYFKTNKKHLYEYPNLWLHTRRMYSNPLIRDTVNFPIIKNHYFRSHTARLNPFGVVPSGPDLDYSLLPDEE